MERVLEWLNPAASAWWTYILAASWQATAVGVVLLLVVHGPGRRWPAPLRYSLLVVGLLKFACPPWLSVPTGLFSRLTAPALILPASLEGKPAQAPGVRGQGSNLTLEPGGLSSSPLWLMGLHGLGTIAVLGLIAAQASRLRNVRRVSRSRLGKRLGAHYRDLAIQLGVYRIPPLAVSETVDAPMAFGMAKPAIAVPAKIVRTLSWSELRAVLAHELAHCARGDPWLNGVQLLLVAVWWFHPVIWLLNRSLRSVREDCCDDLVLARQVVSNDAYCDVLMRTATQLCQVAPLDTAIGFTSSRHPLARRMARLSDLTLKRYDRVPAFGGCAVLLVAAVLLPGLQTNPSSPNSGEMHRSQKVAVARLPSEATPPPVRPEAAQRPSPSRTATYGVTLRPSDPLPHSKDLLRRPLDVAPSTPRQQDALAQVDTHVSGLLVQGRTPSAFASVPRRVASPLANRPPTPGVLSPSAPSRRVQQINIYRAVFQPRPTTLGGYSRSTAAGFAVQPGN